MSVNKLEKLPIFLKNMEINIAFKSNNTTENHLKPCNIRCDIYSNSGAYQLTCQDCPKIYVGQTRHTFRARYREHIQATKAKKNVFQICTVRLRCSTHIWPNRKHYDDVASGYQGKIHEYSGKVLYTKH
jgi:hypothetical protein